MKKVTNYIEGLDFFGMPVLLTFNNKGSEHKTVIGGCLSIIIRLIMLVYMGILFQRMYFKLDNKNETYVVPVEEIKEMKFGDTGVKILINVIDMITG